MSYLKKAGLAALSAMALMGMVATTASATTLEVGGVALNQTVAIDASLEAESATAWETTTGNVLNVCTESTIKANTEGTFTGGVTVGGKVAEFTFPACGQAITALKPGTFTIEWTSATIGTVRSTGTELEFKDPLLKVAIKCTTNNTDIGLLTGVKTGHATLDINAVINCGALRPSVNWLGAYTVTSPTGLGVVK